MFAEPFHCVMLHAVSKLGPQLRPLYIQMDLDMQSIAPKRSGLHVPMLAPQCTSLICSAIALEPDGSLPLVSALLLGHRWIRRPSRRKRPAIGQIASPHIGTPSRIDPQIAATVSQTCFFLPFTAMQSIIPLLVAQKFELSAELWGAVCAAEGFAKIICAMPVAAILSSWGRKPVLVFSFVCFGLSMIALAHGNTVFGVLGAKLLVGASILAQNSGMQLFLTDISTSENKSRVMAPVLMAEKLSSMLGPLIGGKMIQSFGATMATTQLAVLTFFFGLLNQGMLKETKPEVQPQAVQGSPKGKFLQLFKDVRVQEAVIFSAFYWGIMASTLYCLVPLMLAQVFSLGALAFSIVLAATNLLCFFCAKPAAEWSDRWGRKAVLVPGMVLVGIATLLLPVVPKVATSQSSEILALTLLLGALAIGQGLVGPALPTIFTDGLAPSLHVESLSLLRMSTEIGAVILSLAMSFCVGSCGFAFPLVAAGLAALFAAGRFSLKYNL